MKGCKQEGGLRLVAGLMHHGRVGAEHGSRLMHHMKGCKPEGGLRLVAGMMHRGQEGVERSSHLMHHIRAASRKADPA